MADRTDAGRAPGSRPHGSGLNPLAAAPIRHRLASRPKYVTLAAVPFLIGAFFQDAAGMVGSLLAFGLIATAMWMTREGLAAEAAYEVRTVARRPMLPRKLLGSLLTGLGLGLGAADPGGLGAAGLGSAALVGATGMVLHWLAFGADPLRDKGEAPVADFQQERARKMIDEGEAHLARMREAIRLTGEPALLARLDRFAERVQALLDRLRSNPGDLSALRRYLGVYLQGAGEATAKFAQLYRRDGDPALRRSYETLLDDLEKDFTARSDRLLTGDRSDLEIEIAVLRDRLAQDGQAAPLPAGGDAPRSQTARFIDDLLGPGRRGAR